MGTCPRDSGPVVGNSWALFLSVGELSPVENNQLEIVCFAKKKTSFPGFLGKIFPRKQQQQKYPEKTGPRMRSLFPLNWGGGGGGGYRTHVKKKGY